MEKISGTEKRTGRGRKGGGINHERKEEIKSEHVPASCHDPAVLRDVRDGLCQDTELLKPLYFQCGSDCHRYRHDDRHDHRRYRYQRRFLRGDGLYDVGMDDGKRRYRCGSGGSHRAGDRDCLWSGTGIPGCLHGYSAIHCYPGGYVLCPRHDCDHFQGHDQYYE